MNGKRPKDGSRKALADRLGVSTVAVSKAVRDGRIADAIQPDGSLDVDKAEALWKANTHPADRRNKRTKKVTRKTDADTLRQEAEAIGIDPGNVLSYNDAATLLKNYQAKLAELEYEQKSGELVSKAEYDKAMFKLIRGQRDAMLAIPDRLSAEIAGMTDPFAVHARISGEIRAAIEGMLADGE